MAAIINGVVAQEVLRFMHQAHFGQERFPGYPYVVHPNAVSQNVLLCAEDLGEWLSEAFFTAGVHDVDEDTDASVADVCQITGLPIIESATKALSKNKQLPRAEQLHDSLRRSAAVGFWVVVVKACDRVDNLNLATFSLDWQFGYCRHYAGDDVALILQALKTCGVPTPQTQDLLRRAQKVCLQQLEEISARLADISGLDALTLREVWQLLEQRTGI